MSGVFALVGAGVFFGLHHYLRVNLADTLGRRSAQVEQILLQAPAEAGAGAIAREIDTRVAPEFNNRFVRVTRLPATVIYRSRMPADRSFDPSAVTVPQSDGAKPVTTVVPDQHLMVRVTPVHAVSGDYRVELGVSTARIEEALERLLDLLALLLPVLVVCAAGGGYWLVSWALRPVDRLSQTAEQMSLQNLSLRLPVVPSGDALERLSISFNTMLGRLRDSVQTSRRFLADASHELRTPLTVIKGELQELTRESHLAEGDLHERIGSVLEEVARLEHLVSGLLVLSRLDAGEAQGAWVDVDLAELALNTAEHMQLMAEDRGVEIDVSELQKTVIRGDRARLKQIVVNLLDNAIRFTLRGGTVSLRTAADNAAGVLEVADTGIGIPPAAIPEVFDRFFRVDEGRSREDGGAGLGLAIVKSICLAHGAEIEVRSRPEFGSCFRVTFPKRSLAPAPAPAPAPAEPEAPLAGPKG
ncbi:MAG TPA: HAMP domain-containing sensor histidine kinase [Steroidobacteraceae bacterium]|nr:HAMP domain-containing sensor histidine kinase [Steroidobacteraceae bacterium]